jgi:protein-L-isoaspartate(D-aspartate) O-methyltransferase
VWKAPSTHSQPLSSLSRKARALLGRRTLWSVDVVRASRLAAAAYVAGVRDTRVLQAMAAVPRSAYVPDAEAGAARRDRPIAIGGGQVTTQPSLVAAMVEALELGGDERVLEIGTGLGYQAAVLARLAREVWTVEYRPELAAVAAANLLAQGVVNAHVVTGDGTDGLPEHAPFDAVVLAAAYPRVPPPVAAEVAPGGRLVQPIGPGGSEDVTLFRRRPDGGLVRVRSVARARFVPLYGRYGFSEDR